MAKHSKRLLFFYLLLLAVFMLSPLLCVYLDQDDHFLPDPNCPLCTFLVTFVAVLAGLFIAYCYSKRLFHHLLFVIAHNVACQYTGGPTSVRDPPLFFSSVS